MCGICGVVSLRRGEAPRVLTAMNDQLVHRGPDDGDSDYHGSVGIGMRRLSIIGVDNGHQPIYNETGDIALVMNGEIYNYLEIKAGLIERGHRFATASDAEVAVHLYEEQGPDFINQLQGMFALALHDRAAKRLLIYRDRPGKKPLYYAEHQGNLIFASEIKALHASGLLPKELDRRGLRSYLAYGFVLGDRTLFHRVRKLPAAHYLQIDLAEDVTADDVSAEDVTAEDEPAAVSIHRYWDQPRAVASCDDDFKTAAGRIRDLLEEGVRKRLMSEVPLGAFLSGGVDSSTIVAIMRRHFDQPLQTFSVGFADRGLNELPHARQVAELFDTQHHELLLRGVNLPLLRDINHYYDEPVGDPAAVPTYCLATFARRHITVTLTGEGGDEIFAGYPHHGHSRRLAELRRKVPGLALLARMAGTTERLFGPLAPARLWKALWLSGLPQGEEMRGWSAAFTDRELHLLLSSSSALESPISSLSEPLAELRQRVEHLDPLSQLLYVDARSGLADQLLMKVDKMGMAASLEARCPLLDQDLVEYAASLPSDMKLTAQGGKQVFRRALEGLIPSSILDRPKQGFDVPLHSWLQQDVPQAVDRLLLSKQSPLAEFLQQDALAALWKAYRKNQDSRRGFQIWRLLNFALWHEMHWPRGLLDELLKTEPEDDPIDRVFVPVTSTS